MTNAEKSDKTIDAVIVGAGFAGIYMLYKLQNQKELWVGLQSKF